MRFESLAASLASSLLTAALFVAVTAVADGDPTTDTVPRVIPYTGSLERDGAPVTLLGDAAPWMRFDLTSGPAEGAPVVYSQVTQVPVHGGRFTVMLGPTGTGGVSLATAVAAADSLHMRMTLLGDPAVPGDDIALAGAQQVLMAPFAMWATDATDFSVARDLTVARDAFVGRNLETVGNVEAGSLDVNGAARLAGTAAVTGALTAASSLTVTGTTTLNGATRLNGDISDENSAVTINDGLNVTGGFEMGGSDFVIRHTPRGDGGRALVQDASDRLVINFANDFAGDTQVQSDLWINGRLGTGGLQPGLHHTSCVWRNASPYNWENNTFHTATCNNGEFMAGWRCWATDRLDGECGAYCCTP